MVKVKIAPRLLNFNPRSRTESDFWAACLEHRIIYISIHALARRATTEIPETISVTLISIHALARRATSPSKQLPAKEQFQSTLSHGERLRALSALI